MRYDTLGRKTYMNDPDMGVWNYIYDANGNLETQTDAKLQVITFGYDGLNRLTTKHHGTNLVLTNYYNETDYTNPKGRLTRMTDLSGQTVYNYDNMGRATSTTKTINGVSYNLGFSFLNGRLDSITYPDTETVSYTYDAGYLKGATGYVSYSNFDSLGRPLNATFGTGGASSLFTFYSDSQRLHTLSVVSPNQGLLIDNSYEYDHKGNITSITDSLNKPLPTSISSETYTPTRAHAVGSTVSGRTFTLDNNGNITNDGLRSFVYNYENMPTQVGSVSITYDGAGQRVKKTFGARATVYIDKLYECTNGLCAKFIFAGDTRIAMKTGTEIKFYHPDHQGSTSVVTNAVGNKIDELSYLPFGETRTGIASSVSHRYTGQELDGESGLYNYNARLYDPEMGRFLTADSIVPDPTNPQSLNRYSYVHNNPLNYTDPTGHCEFLCMSAIYIGAAVVSYVADRFNGDHNTSVGASVGNNGVSFNVSNGNSRSNSGGTDYPDSSGSAWFGSTLGNAWFEYGGGDTALGVFSLYDYNAASYGASPNEYPEKGSNNIGQRIATSPAAGIARAQKYLNDVNYNSDAAWQRAYDERVNRSWEAITPEGNLLRNAENYLWAYKVVSEGSGHWYGKSGSWLANTAMIPAWQGLRAIENIAGQKLHSPASFDALSAGYQGAWDALTVRKK